MSGLELKERILANLLFSEGKNINRIKKKKINERSEKVIHRRTNKPVRRSLPTLINRLSENTNQHKMSFKTYGSYTLFLSLIKRLFIE